MRFISRNCRITEGYTAGLQIDLRKVESSSAILHRTIHRQGSIDADGEVGILNF